MKIKVTVELEPTLAKGRNYDHYIRALPPPKGRKYDNYILTIPLNGKLADLVPQGTYGGAIVLWNNPGNTRELVAAVRRPKKP